MRATTPFGSTTMKAASMVSAAVRHSCAARSSVATVACSSLTSSSCRAWYTEAVVRATSRRSRRHAATTAVAAIARPRAASSASVRDSATGMVAIRVRGVRIPRIHRLLPTVTGATAATCSAARSR